MSVASIVEKRVERGYDPDKNKKPLNPNGKLLECLLCEQKYSREDIKRGMYQISTMICSPCYARMQRMPYERSCFGKGSEMVNGIKVKFGNEPGAKECQSLCPDRFICRKIVWPEGWPIPTV